MLKYTTVLTIDDDKNILDAYQEILAPNKMNSLQSALQELESLYKNETLQAPQPVKHENLCDFKVLNANNGQSGIDIFRESFHKGDIIPVCIIDMRMPNGLDGLETAMQIKKIDPFVHIIIATAYTDRSNEEIITSLRNNMYYIRKPFNAQEIYQLVYSATTSYINTKELYDLNDTLEQRIVEEKKKNLDKDALMFNQSKLASMGEMISNIAHQWRQPLNVVSLLFQKINYLHKKGTLSSETLEEITNQSFNTIEHMSQTIDDFRNYFEPNVESTPYNLSDVVLKTVALVKESFNLYGITINTLNIEDITLKGYPDRLKQVLLNLLNNAKDALKEHNIPQGTITIDCQRNNEEAIIMNIQDNAGGIPADILDKIFEPYFTTKHKSQGTGIGLYMSKKIIEECFLGYIDVSNTQDGAKFSITLPTMESK